MTIEKLDASTPDLTQQNIERLLELFPDCRTEGSREDAPMVDFDLLRQALSDYLVEGPAERYRLDWPGKRQALLTANTPIDKTLRPMREESVDFDTTRNLFIEGDNLDALKLLQETYLGKVKMIYIDPPYNTGNDFIYNDNFRMSREDYESESDQRDETGGRLIANPESRGRFHSDWLSMMYPRLKLARSLLSDEGAIFVSIDDGEAANLRQVLDQVFGAQNFIANIVWQKKQSPQSDATNFSDMHDHILVYAKLKKEKKTDTVGWSRNLLPRDETQESRYKNPDNDPRGVWASVDATINKSKDERPNLYYGVKNPHNGEEVFPNDQRVWSMGRANFIELIADNQVWWGKDGDNFPRLKRYLSEVQDGVVPSTWWTREFAGDNQGSRRELRKLFPEAEADFSTPKPTLLVRRMIEIATNKDDLVVDFFAGSSTSALSVLGANAQDGGTRRFVMVQLPEAIDENSEAYRKGFCSIADISRERIRRAGSQILEDNPELKNGLDTGFRALRIDTGNFVNTSVTPKEATQAALAGMVSHIKDDRSEEDLLFGALLRWGVDITLPIEQRELAGRTVWLVDAPEDGSGKGAALIACFAKPGSSGKGGIDTELADAMAELAPLRVLFRDDGFADDATKENVHSRFQQRAPDTQVRVL